jgi:hypothetical protein
MVPTPAREEANDDDHETSNHATTELCRSTNIHTAPEWYGHLVLDVMLLDNDEHTNYEEAMMRSDSEEWLEAMKYGIGSATCELRWDFLRSGRVKQYSS